MKGDTMSKFPTCAVCGRPLGAEDLPTPPFRPYVNYEGAIIETCRDCKAEGYVVCPGCGGVYDCNKDDEEMGIDGEMYCRECCESECEHCNTVVKIPSAEEHANGDDVLVVHFTDHFVWDDAGEFEWERLPDPIAELSWHSTGGWHGHEEFTFGEKFEVVDGGWVTGYPDSSTRRKVAVSNIYEAMRSGEVVPPMTVYFVLATTSNLFSLALDIVIPKGEKEAFLEWLEAKFDTNAGDLEYMLS